MACAHHPSCLLPRRKSQPALARWVWLSNWSLMYGPWRQWRLESAVFWILYLGRWVTRQLWKHRTASRKFRVSHSAYGSITGTEKVQWGTRNYKVIKLQLSRICFKIKRLGWTEWGVQVRQYRLWVGGCWSWAMGTWRSIVLFFLL